MRSVAILSNYGNRNLGDEASLDAIVDQLRERCIEVTLHAISFDPDDTQARHGLAAVPAVPLGRASRADRGARVDGSVPSRPTTSGPLARAKDTLKVVPFARRFARLARGAPAAVRAIAAEIALVVRSVRLMRGIDLLIVGGGGQLADDFGGMWGLPYVILKWTVIARMAGARVVFLSVGAGPLESRSARLFSKCALRLADYRSFRDEASREMLAELGVTGDVYPDVAFLLPVKSPERRTPPESTRLTVGLNPFPYQDGHYWPGGDLEAYRRYLDTLARFAQSLIDRGHSVVLFPTQLRADPRVIRDLKARLTIDPTAGRPELSEATVDTVADLVEAISGLDLVVTGRFHGILLSYLVHKPVVGLSYQHKMDELMSQMGQLDYVLPIGRVSVPALLRCVEDIESRLPRLSRDLLEATARQRQRLAEQFDLVFGPVPSKGHCAVNPNRSGAA
ncbi:MAG TPA: polysaccharide pyruvyl transferase family protein [Methylomirabilota bacterium]|nr:polysaccharide pyruvyl transferase family protein [Methylomirabilota bacterium]